MPTRPSRYFVRALSVAGAAAMATALALPGAQAAAGHPRAGANILHQPAGVKLIHPGAARAAGLASMTLSLRSSSVNGAISPTPKVYLVFWGSQWSTSDPAGVAPDMQAMFRGLFGSADNWGTILDQYCGGLPVGTTHCGTSGTHIHHPASTPLAGVWFDNAAAEPTSATKAQLAAEAKKAAGHFGNTTQNLNLDAQYVVLSDHGTHPDGFPNTGFCGWHDFTTTSYGNLAYTNLPYVPDLGVGACTTIVGGRLLNGIESTETHEYAETVSDFWPVRGWYNNSGGEIGDECVNLDRLISLTTGTFDVQGLWSNSANKCVTKT